VSGKEEELEGDEEEGDEEGEKGMRVDHTGRIQRSQLEAVGCVLILGTDVLLEADFVSEMVVEGT